MTNKAWSDAKKRDVNFLRGFLITANVPTLDNRVMLRMILDKLEEIEKRIEKLERQKK